MSLSIDERGTWKVIELKGRIDSFNHEKIVKELLDLVDGETGRLCIDLSKVNFLSLPTIRFFNQQARKWTESNLNFAIVGGSDKTRRHLEIFGDLEYIRLLQDIEELQGIEGEIEGGRLPLTNNKLIENSP